MFNGGAGKFYFSARSNYDMPMKARSDWGDVVPTHSQHGDSMWWVVNPRPRLLYPHEKSGTLFTGGCLSLGATLGITGTLSPPGFNPRTVESVANHYAILAAFNSVFLLVLFE